MSDDLHKQLTGECRGGQCWYNPETGYVEYCEEHDSQVADIVMSSPKWNPKENHDLR